MTLALLTVAASALTLISWVSLDLYEQLIARPNRARRTTPHGTPGLLSQN